MMDGARLLVSNGEILLYGVIDGVAAPDTVRAVDVIVSLQALPARSSIVVRINSPGGSVSEGLAIYNALRNDPRRVICQVDAMAASVASVIMCAGDEISIAETASIMIHDPWTVAVGSADTMRAAANEIERMKMIILDIYEKRTGLDRAEISALMSAETYLSAGDAIERGFADRLVEDLKVAACAPLDRARLARLLFGAEESSEAPPDRSLEMSKNEPGAPRAPAPAPAPAPAAPAPIVNAALEILNSCEAAGLDLPTSREILSQAGGDVARGRALVIDALATAQAGAGAGGEIRAQFARNDATLENPEFRQRAMADGIYARLTGREAEGPARQFAAMRFADMAGIRNSGLLGGGGGRFLRSDAGGRLTTSDFPIALGSAGQRILAERMRAAESGLSQVAATGRVNDFRTVTEIRTGSFPSLQQVNEAGEIQSGAIDENGESYAVASFARRLDVSFQALTNDDTGAFEAGIRDYALAAAELKSRLLATALTAKLADGKALFHSDHANLAASGAALDVASLSAGRVAMRQQKALDGATPLGIAPRVLLVPSTLETLAEQLVTEIQAVTFDAVNPFASKLVVAVEPRLSGTPWYLFADPGLHPAIKFVTLAGFDTPRFEVNDAWDVLGTSFRVHWHCGAAPVDFRPAYKNPGA